MNPNADINALYRQLLDEKNDISKHLPTIIKFGEEVNHITEFGVRTGVSTLGWLMAKPKKLICYDIVNLIQKRNRLERYKEFANLHNIDFQFIVANDLEIEIEPTELLFIDTSHTYEHTVKELELHAHKVSKYLAFHDTIGQDGKNVIPAIGKFLYESKEWLIKAHYNYCFGFTVLERHKDI